MKKGMHYGNKGSGTGASYGMTKRSTTSPAGKSLGGPKMIGKGGNTNSGCVG